MPRVFGAYRQLRLEDGRIVTVRSDTRFYFGVQCGRTPKSFGRCVGAFYLINPGSAESESGARQKDGLVSHGWGPLVYHREDLLPTLERALDGAYCRVNRDDIRRGRRLLESCYIQILNLSYVKSAGDAKQSLVDWRRLVGEKRVKDDTPRDKQLAFVVFGWGRYYDSGQDGLRVSSVLKRCVGQETQLIFPRSAAIWERGEVDRELAQRAELQSQLKRPNNYPCGPSRYPKGDLRTRREYCNRYVR
ncbi:MAG: hypothetical protein KDA37_17785, partial [Planctomycetales bacterium]|nr:hypothetical protein [Planctomycetales bacterium]